MGIRGWGRNYLAVLIGCAALLLATGCGGSGGGGGSAALDGEAATGRVAVLVTDAPAEDFDQILVTVTGVELLSESGSVPVFPVGDDPAERVVDLLALRDRAELMFDSDRVPAGCYGKLRLSVRAVELVEVVPDDPATPQDEGETVVHQAAVPANGKIDLNPRGEFCVEQGQILALQLDLDANKSIHVVEKRQGREYRFRPVVFVDVLTTASPGKLVRLSGYAESVDVDSFVLCPPLELETTGMGAIWGRCAEVQVGPETSLFGSDAGPLDPAVELQEVLAEGQFVTAVGRYGMVVEPQAADPSTGAVLPQFTAELLELGSGWRTYRGMVTVPPDQCPVGTLRVQLEPGQGFDPDGNTELPVHLFAETRLFSRAGEPLACGDLEIGQRVAVDALLYLSDDVDGPDVLEAALLMVAPAVPERQVDGTLVAFDEGTLTLQPEGSDATVCVVPRDGVVPLLYDEAAGTLDAIALTDLEAGVPVTAYGDWRADGSCFAAGAVVAWSLPPPES